MNYRKMALLIRRERIGLWLEARMPHDTPTGLEAYTWLMSDIPAGFFQTKLGPWPTGKK